MTSFQSVSSDRARWEDAVNESFAVVGRTERVCNHADCTVTVRDASYVTSCDYCPACSFTYYAPMAPVPWYYTDA